MTNRYPLTQKTRNLVRFCRHLPHETMAADFAADFAFRARGSRFSLLKSPRTAPGPDEYFSAFSGDVRLVCEKLLVLELRSLARMARRLDKPGGAAEWEQLANGLAGAINTHLLEPASGVYLDRRLDNGRFGDMISMASFVPMQAGIAPPEAARNICRRYLLDETRFYTTLPFPTLDREEAINECYDSLTGQGNGHPEFMWSSAAVLILATQYYRQFAVADGAGEGKQGNS